MKKTKLCTIGTFAAVPLALTACSTQQTNKNSEESNVRDSLIIDPSTQSNTQEIKYSWLTYDGKDYELEEYLNPSLFCAEDVNSTAAIPLKVRWTGGIVNIGGSQEAWAKVTSLKLTSCDKWVSTVKDYFLTYCTNLKTLDLSGFNAISYIGKAFLENCTSLESLTLPNKDPKDFKINVEGFLANIPSNTVIHCGEYLEEYKTTEPWSQKADQMVADHVYSITNISNNDRIKALQTTTVAQLKLLDWGKEVSENVTWKVTDGTDAYLNASINGDELMVSPTLDAVDKKSKIAVSAYVNNELASTREFIINDIYADKCCMIFNGKEYKLPFDIDPNLFSTISNATGVKTPTIPLRDGSTLKINGYSDWKKLDALYLSYCDSSVTSLNTNFLKLCTGLQAVDLSGLKNIDYISYGFLQECSSLKQITLPKVSPKAIELFDEEDNLMVGFAADALIGCGEFLDEYKTTAPWSVYADRMVDVVHNYSIIINGDHFTCPKTDRVYSARLMLFDNDVQVKNNVSWSVWTDGYINIGITTEGDVMKMVAPLVAVNKIANVHLSAHINGEIVYTYSFMVVAQSGSSSSSDGPLI